MTAQSAFVLRGRNPDILTCIANLSNDEVFTPPELANRMLDTLADAWAANNNGANIWADKAVTFLDPCTKSGVFLREITSRLTEGLKDALPDLQERVDHILTKQVFGIGITRITSLLARRSVYCSKLANGEHSIVNSFTDGAGNIWFERTEHFWEGSRCRYCSSPKATLGRDIEVENYAYPFIHTANIKTWVNEKLGGRMQFDVVIGNPPYQLSTGGTGGTGVQARPIYNLFVDQAKALEPRYLCFITPSRWFSGGMGLDDFRARMLADSRIRSIHDFPDSNDIFPGTQVKGGVSFFLWDRNWHGDVRVVTHDHARVVSTAERRLLEPGADVFIRYNEGVQILRKIARAENSNSGNDLNLPDTKRFMNLVSSIGAFGLDTTFKGRSSARIDDLKVYRNGGIGYVARQEISKELHVIDKWKVFIPRAGSGSDSFPHQILGKPFVGEPGSISSWTYLHIGPFATRREAQNVISYIRTRLFRFLVLLHKSTQDATRSVYTFVPLQDFSEAMTDDDLYRKYKLSKAEIAFIESMIRPLGSDDE